MLREVVGEMLLLVHFKHVWTVENIICGVLFQFIAYVPWWLIFTRLIHGVEFHHLFLGQVVGGAWSPWFIDLEFLKDGGKSRCVFLFPLRLLNLFNIGKPRQIKCQSLAVFFCAWKRVWRGTLFVQPESVQPPTWVYLSQMVSLVSLVTSSLVVIKYSTGFLWMTRDSLNVMNYLSDGAL